MNKLEEHDFLICPLHKLSLGFMSNEPALKCQACSKTFPHSNKIFGYEFTSFAALEEEEIAKNAILYDSQTLNERYQNFLNWLFQTFGVDEGSVRQKIFRELNMSAGMNVLITSVGNGDDIVHLVKANPNINLNIYGQDISTEMCMFTLNRLGNLGIRIKDLNVSNLSSLPYKSNYFDIVFHFGGINWINNKAAAISEMVRVCKDYGKIGIVDESVGTWLRNEDFGRMMIQNNALWSAEVPLDILPSNINSVKLEYILENCFYFLSFIKDPKFPNVNLDVRHIGPRGGSIRTRYFGKLEGIDPKLAGAVRAAAKEEGMSEVDWLEKTLRKSLGS